MAAGRGWRPNDRAGAAAAQNMLLSLRLSAAATGVCAGMREQRGRVSKRGRNNTTGNEQRAGVHRARNNDERREEKEEAGATPTSCGAGEHWDSCYAASTFWLLPQGRRLPLFPTDPVPSLAIPSR